MPLNLSNTVSCDTTCVPQLLPSNTVGDSCKCTTLSGRLNDVLFTPCSVTYTEAEYKDPNFWQGLVDNDELRRFSRKGLGGWSSANTVTQDLGGCGGEQITEKEWDITWKHFCMDRSDLALDHAFAAGLVEGCINQYNVHLRLCADSDTLVHVGRVTIVEYDNPLPDATSEFSYFEFTFRYKGLTFPAPTLVPGLTAVIPMN